MSTIDYSDSPYSVPPRYAEAHNRYWKKLAAPGTWLTGAERVAVAKEVRQAPFCKLSQERKKALSPYQVDGTLDSVTDLPDVYVEVVHRIITDPGRLTKAWYDGLMQQGLTPEKYVEILGTLGCVFTIDEFCRGLGMPLNDLPQPQPGEPSQYRPANILEDGEGAWVPILPNIVDSGPESDLWEGRTGYVIRALSLVPDEVRSMLDLLDVHYMNNNEIWNVTGSRRGTLSRMQMEVIAARVSALNGCFY